MDTTSGNYQTVQLNLEVGAFLPLWQWTVNSLQQPTTVMNAQGYNPVDGIAYGVFSPSTTTTSNARDGYLCRFSHVQNSAACLCETLYWGYTATVTRDGTFYLAKDGGDRIAKLPNVASIAYPPNSPAPYTSLGSCGMTELLPGGKGTGGAVSVSSSAGLTTAELEDAYSLTSDCRSKCYMNIWTKSGSRMTSWSPGNQGFSDIIDFEYRDITYLIGLGNSDASVFIVKLDGDGGGDVSGYAYSRVVVDYTGSTSSIRTMQGFGAG